MLKRAEILSNEIGRRISYVDIPEQDGRRGMKQVCMENWLIDALMELYNRIKAGHESKTTTVVEQITGKPISFAQFAKYYVGFFRYKMTKGTRSRSVTTIARDRD